MPEADNQTDPTVPNRDTVLAALTATTNQSGSSFTITLTVGGTLITGTLVADHVWMRRQADLFGQSEGGKRFADFFSHITELTQSRALAELEEDDSAEPIYIHLLNAQTLAGNNAHYPDDGTGMWRGRLASVDGWSLGRLGDRPDPWDDGSASPEFLASAADIQTEE